MANRTENRAPHNWPDFPLGMRAAVVVLVLLLFWVGLFVVTTLFAVTWKLDPGIVTLLGAIIGLGIVGWQARVGFNHLIRSQENQAALERDARLHQYELDRAAQEGEQAGQRKTLIAALRAEVFYLSLKAGEARRWAITMTALQEVAVEEGFPNTTTKISMYSFDAPVFKTNISQLGLLGASLAADVVAVCSRATPSLVAEFDKPPPARMIAGLYAAHQKELENWEQDLVHVGRRLQAAEEGTPDLEQLVLVQARRRGAQASQQNSADRKR
jgi:hypothetical protein